MGVFRQLIAAPVLFASGASAAVPLDNLIAFDNPHLCHPSKDFDALLSGVIRWEELSEPTSSNDIYKGTLASPPVPARYRKQVGKPKLTAEGDEYRATIPLRGTWQGLPLRSLVVVQWVESEGGFYLVFDATREQVHEAANRAGMGIPAALTEYRDEGVIGVTVGVSAQGRSGVLYCFVG